MEKSESETPMYRAYHEAGHAVASCLLGIPILYTSITPSEEDGYMGITEAPVKRNPSRHEILNDMLVLAAGMIATTFLPRNPNHGDDSVGISDDIQRIQNHARHLAAGDHSEYLRLSDETYIRARKLLETSSHCAAVKRVAESLLERHTLDQAEVQQIIDQTTE
jgi:ATP-dependent Zn protease